MRSPDLPSHLKPLYANLLRIEILNFLSTSSFEHLMIENDWDQCWYGCLESAKRLNRLNNVLTTGYISCVKPALGFFITVVNSADPEVFFYFIHKLLEAYLKSIESSFELVILRSPLITAGYKEEDVDSLLTELQTIKSLVSKTKNNAQKTDDLTTVPLEIHSADIGESLDHVIQLCNRFHIVAKHFRKRHENRETLDVTDEYDVQDLLHGLLRIFFDDIRPEECTPSYAGKATRMDFLLKKEEIVVEIKMTRKGLSDKEVADQLILDIARYRYHPSCKTLVCFVYDPEGKIANPSGLQADLSGDKQGLKVILLIAPNLQ